MMQHLFWNCLRKVLWTFYRVENTDSIIVANCCVSIANDEPQQNIVSLIGEVIGMLLVKSTFSSCVFPDGNNPFSPSGKNGFVRMWAIF